MTELTPDLLAQYLTPLVRVYGEEIAQQTALGILTRLQYAPIVVRRETDITFYLLRCGRNHWIAAKRAAAQFTGICADSNFRHSTQVPEQLRRLEAREQLDGAPLSLVEFELRGSGPASSSIRHKRMRFKRAARP